MKLLAVFSTTALAVLLGISVPVYTQQDEPHPQEEKRAQPDEKAAHDQNKQQEDKHVYKNQVDKNQEDKQIDKDKEGKQVDKEKENKHAEQEEKSAHQDERAEAQGERAKASPVGIFLTSVFGPILAASTLSTSAIRSLSKERHDSSMAAIGS